MIRGALTALLLLASLPPAPAANPHAHSDSASLQFSIFCDDTPLRMQVSSFAEEVKHQVLQLLGERDLWKAPIVIVIDQASPGSDLPPAEVRLIQSLPGFKVQINARIGNDPSAINLQKQIVRALLLEYAYRNLGVEGGQAYLEAPWWLVQGSIQLTAQRTNGVKNGLFKRLLAVNKIPPIAEILATHYEDLPPSLQATDQMLAAAFLQLLLEQPNGHASLALFLRSWPKSHGDSIALLKKIFPAIAPDEPTLQKWWTLNFARIANTEIFEGLSMLETHRRFSALLSIDLPASKDREKSTFPIAEFPKYLPLPSSRQALTLRRNQVLALSANANPIFRQPLNDYSQVLSSLIQGKTLGVQSLLSKINRDTANALRLASAIDDYLNWFQLSHPSTSAHSFDDYLKTIQSIENQQRQRSIPIARYLDIFDQK
ncbi:MAG: hypothetical protein WCI46_11335 [Verrucomicrobiota bacterium]